MAKPELLISKKFKDLEKAVFEITEAYGEKILDDIELLRELFKRGFTFTAPQKVYRSEFAKYARKLAELELEKMKTPEVEEREPLKFKRESLLLLREVAHYYLASYHTWLWHSLLDFAFLIFKNPYHYNYLSTLCDAQFYKDLEALERELERQKRWEEWLSQTKKEREEEYLFWRSLYEETDFTYNQEHQPEVREEERKQEEEEEEEYNPFKEIYESVKELVEKENTYIPPEVLKGKLTQKGIDFSKIYFNEFRYELLGTIQGCIEDLIAEDEEMWNAFAYGDLNDIGKDCKDIEDYQNKDCRLLYLYTLWLLCDIVPKRHVLRFVRFVRDRIKPSPVIKSYIDLLYYELERY